MAETRHECGYQLQHPAALMTNQNKPNVTNVIGRVTIFQGGKIVSIDQSNDHGSKQGCRKIRHFESTNKLNTIMRRPLLSDQFTIMFTAARLSDRANNSRRGYAKSIPCRVTVTFKACGS